MSVARENRTIFRFSVFFFFFILTSTTRRNNIYDIIYYTFARNRKFWPYGIYCTFVVQLVRLGGDNDKRRIFGSAVSWSGGETSDERTKSIKQETTTTTAAAAWFSIMYSVIHTAGAHSTCPTIAVNAYQQNVLTDVIIFIILLMYWRRQRFWTEFGDKNVLIN